jgi:phosphoribosylformylglycinamidine cyclo-ligase
MSTSERYMQRGVSASKSEVHDAIKNIDKGLYPNAFCKILPDIVAGKDDYCNIMHADTAGTKTSLAYIYWKETGDLDVWKGIVEDAIVMNIDDLACVGCCDDIIISSTIGRNKHLVPGEVLAVLINHANDFLAMLKTHGINAYLSGGETADVGDIVRTVDVGITAFARMPRSKVIEIDAQPGCLIVGLSSYGRASYESSYNAGMGSNGLSSARHDVFHHMYAEKYPESFDPNTDKKYIYSGSKMLTDTIAIENQEIPLGKLVLSPTRTYLPLIKKILEVNNGEIKGMVHCSGGGQTKIMKFVKNNVRVIKDQLLPVPPLFKIIQEESGTGRREMFEVFNMGHRMEILTDCKEFAHRIIDLANVFNIDSQIIGRVEESESPSLVIEHAGETFDY